MLDINVIYEMDCLQGLKMLDDNSINCCVTSPPYWNLRDYGVEGQLGLEETPEEYVEKLVNIFQEVKRVLKPDGTLWLNLGDSYAGCGMTGLKPKDLVGIPWMVAFALRSDGWYLRSDIIWHKPNAMPESVKDRPTKAHEYIFLFSKSLNYYYDKDSIMEPLAPSSITRLSQDISKQKGSTRANGGNKLNGNMKAVFTVRGSKGIINNKLNSGRRDNDISVDVPIGRNKRTVWTVPTAKFTESHFATFPPELIEPCILAGCPIDGIVLDPFMGSGTTAMVALQNQRNFIGFELNPEYIKIADRRINEIQIKLTV